MTEPSTSDFMPQWQYDHIQDRDYVQDEAAIQWRGMHRVAEQVRRREDHHLEGDFDAMDFEARAAALEAHFFGARRRSPPSERTVSRVRPQSASLTRRIADSDPSIASNFDVLRRQRPQSAKNRSDIPHTSEGIDWSTPTESKASKWREMLVRGPEFKQHTLRQLEIETYELLYSTLEHINVQPSARTRKRKKKASEAPRSNSKELACGSGLHLARSRKKRQQEHDRELMLGKTRQPSRRSERERAKAETEEKQAIQDKTRRRGKQLQTKTSRMQLQERLPVQVPTQDKRTVEVCIQRPLSANRARGPWIPSGSASSVGIRGISLASEVTQDKRIEQMLEAFQSQAQAHLSKSKNVQNQLKKAQQRMESCRPGAPKPMNKSGRPASAPRIATSCTDEVKEVYLQTLKGNQENDRIRAANFREPTLSAPVLTDLQLSACEIEALISESPATPKLVIPPLRFPPNLWKYQLTDDSQDGMPGFPQQSSCRLPSNSLGADDDISHVKATRDDEIEGESTPLCDISTKMEHVDKMKTLVEMPANDEDRRTTVEDLYLAEGLDEQASSVFSSGGNETLLSELEPESQTLRGGFGKNDKGMNIELVDPGTPTSKGVEDAQISTTLNEERIPTEISTSSVNAADSPLQEAVDAAKGSSVENDMLPETSDLSSREQDFSVGTLVKTADSPLEEVADTSKDRSVENEIFAETSDLSSREQDLSVVTLVETADIDFSGSEQQLSVDHNVYEGHRSNMIMADNEGDGIDADVIMDEDLLQQTEYDDLPLVEQRGSTEYELNGSGFEELKPAPDVTTSLTLVPSTPVEAELGQLRSVIPLPPELELSHSSPDYPESITYVVNLDTPLEMQVQISLVGVLNVDRNDLATIEDSGMPPSNPTLTIETGTLNLSGESNEVGETGQLRAYATVKTIDCEDSIASTLQLGNADHYRTSADNGEQESEHIESPQQMSLDIFSACTPPADKSAGAPEAEFEQIPTQAETTVLTPVAHEDKVEGDPLRLHQQEVTRSFLKRISSRTCTVVEPELATSQPEPRKEQVEDDDTLGSTERTGVVMGVESQVEQTVKSVKEQEHIHGDYCVVECEKAQALEEHEPTIERYPPATVNPATTASTEKVDAAESFTSADGDSTVTDREDIAPPSTSTETPWQQEPDPNNVTDWDKHTLSHLASSDAAEVDDQGSQPPVEHYNAARNIQAQYRCFVRRRLILDQLHFMVANQRRQARRKSRQKERKTKTVDMVTPMSVPKSMDSLPEEAQPVALTTKGVEVAPELPLMEEPRPSVEDAGLRGRKGSCEYAFDLIDSSNEASGEAKLGVSARTAEDCAEVLRANGTRSEKLEQQQESPTILSEKNVDKTTTSFEVLQGEETNAQLPSDTIEVKPNREEPTAPASTSFLASTTPAELAVIDNVEENPVPKAVNSTHVEAVPESAGGNPRWERYVDSTTSKSYYFNPSTNETQWTAPAGEGRSNSAIISSRATPTTPHSAAVIAPDAAVSSNRPTESWQEFLDEASGQLYYYNTKTGECLWEPPTSASPGVVESLQSSATAESEAIGASPWIMYIDPASQAPYYVNVETLATSWEQPDDFVVAEPNANGETYVIAVDDHAALEI